MGDGHRESSPFVRWKKGKKKETRGGRKRRLVLSRVGTFQLNCKLKRIFYSSVVGTIGSDRKYSKARATFPSRIKFAISFLVLLDRENLDNFVNDFPNFEGKSNFLRADFQPPPPIGLFETLPVSNTENAGLLDDGFYSTSCFYSSPSVLNILPGDSVSIVILHELPFLRIACSRLKQSGTRRSTWSFLSKFLGVFDESYFLHRL